MPSFIYRKNDNFIFAIEESRGRNHPILSGSDREKHKNSTGTTEQQ